MKNLFNSALRCNRKSFAQQGIFYFLFIGLLITSCQKENRGTPVEEVQSTSNHTMITESNVVHDYSGVLKKTAWELQQARAATARYRNIKNAIKDGYGDISVVLPNMGYHYLKSSFVDATFDIRKPELLVYNKNENGEFQLLAVEYAVPLSLSSNAPQGFSGNQDVWDRNTGFGLWLLHAWVWSYNPDGVFNPTNPLVHLH